MWWRIKDIPIIRKNNMLNPKKKTKKIQEYRRILWRLRKRRRSKKSKKIQKSKKSNNQTAQRKTAQRKTAQRKTAHRKNAQRKTAQPKTERIETTEKKQPKLNRWISLKKQGETVKKKKLSGVRRINFEETRTLRNREIKKNLIKSWDEKTKKSLTY